MNINGNGNKYSIGAGGSVVGAGRLPKPRVRAGGEVGVAPGAAVVADVGVGPWGDAMGYAHPWWGTLT